MLLEPVDIKRGIKLGCWLSPISIH
jgi:hypothetical protein